MKSGNLWSLISKENLIESLVGCTPKGGWGGCPVLFVSSALLMQGSACLLVYIFVISLFCQGLLFLTFCKKKTKET